MDATEVECLVEMARCLQEIGAGRVPEKTRPPPEMGFAAEAPGGRVHHQASDCDPVGVVAGRRLPGMTDRQTATFVVPLAVLAGIAGFLRAGSQGPSGTTIGP